ncbi:hypothetical protein C9374_006593 [Naegleria lovaniensis]|uniref:Adenylate and Guanylate cyclase catalytic domain containing protein n=1 Tax=Naegleria lovaniensis TaxID=51637 RepID=A0AA88GN67_NAELO|nr:uncharacterized protein C9374_006593 [Naegleria lovaniensis]KAG2379476.1 hypothetical protein C9374_006593 [Naegleria lovaniensis]
MSSSDTGTSSASSSAYQFSLASQIKEHVISKLVQLRHTKPMKSWKILTISTIVEICFYYCVFILPTLRDYNWGNIGQYVLVVLNFPNTLLLHWLSYSQSLIASIVMMSIVGISFVILAFTLFIYSSSIKKIRSKIRQLLLIFLYLCKMFNMAILFVWVGFFDCSLSIMLPYSSSNVLNRFQSPQVACLASTNTTMIGLSIFFIIALYVLVLVAEVVTFDTHPQSTKNLFSNSSMTFPLFVRTMSFVSMIQMFAIPQSYTFISAIVNMVISLAYVALLFQTLPFNKRWMNSVFCGWAFGQFGASLGALITSLANSHNDPNMGIGFVGLTVGLLIIGFCFGVISMELYTRWLLHGLVKQIVDHALSIEGVEEEAKLLKTSNEPKTLPMGALTESLGFIYHHMSKSQNFKALCLLFKSALQDLQKEQIIDNIRCVYSDIAFSFAKITLQHKSDEPRVVIGAAEVFAFAKGPDSNTHTVSVELLMKLQRSTFNVFTIFACAVKIKEVQALSDNSRTDSAASKNYTSIQTIKRNQESLLSLYRDFWKEMLNDPISVSNLTKISKKINDLIEESESLFNQLLHHKTRSILQLYASFIELIYFDKELAQTFYQEANSLEEQRYKPSMAPSIKYVKPNKIKPSDDQISIHDHEEMLRPMSTRNLDTLSSFGNNMDSHLDGPHMPEECPSEVLSPEMKKDFLFRNGLKSPRSNSLLRTLFIIYVLIGVGLISGGVVMSVYQFTFIKTNMMNLRTICIPQLAPVSVIRNLRSFQNWLALFVIDDNPWPEFRFGYKFIEKKDYINEHLQLLEEDLNVLRDLIKLGQAVVFDAATYTEYGKKSYSLNIPSVFDANATDSWKRNQYTGTPSIRKAPIIEITNSLIRYIELMRADFPEQCVAYVNQSSTSVQNQQLKPTISNSTYMNPISNYNFMFLWQNSENTAKIYETFCNNYIEKVRTLTQGLILQSQYYFVASLCVYLIVTLLFIVYMQYEFSFVTRLIKVIDKHIQKDIVGKIYQTASHKTEIETSLERTVTAKALSSNVIVVVVVIGIGLLIPFCVGMFFYEARLNAKAALFTFTNVGLSANIIGYLQQSSFLMTEMLTYYTLGRESFRAENGTKLGLFYGHPYFKNHDFQTLYAKVLSTSNKLSDNWNELIYGDVNKPDDDPVIGLYSVLDELLKGQSNCSRYLEQYNIEMNAQNVLENCTGIEKVVTDYLTQTTQISEATRDFFLHQTSTNSTMIELDLYMKHNDLFRFTIPMNRKLQIYMQEFVRSSVELRDSILISLSVIGFVLLGVLSSLLQKMLTNRSNVLQKTRMMLNHVPVDVLDRDDILRNLALYNAYPNIISEKIKSTTAKRVSDSTSSSVSNLISSHVYGTIILNASGEIEIFNSAAHRCFGSKPVDVLGLPFLKLVDPSSEEKVKKTIDSIYASAIKSEKSGDPSSSALNETLDNIQCIRVNQTKFPSTLSIFSTKFVDKGVVIVIVIRDITFELKQQLLLAEEKKTSENLLKNILPDAVAYRLKKGETFICDKFSDITCFFSDMVGFTKISSKMQATDLVIMLNFIVNGFDSLTERYNVEKIKTIGDAYFCVAGLHGDSSDHPERMLRMAMDTFHVVQQFNHGKSQIGPPLDLINIRVGLNNGGVIAGVIGTKKFAYDLWGDTINVASRMESTSLPGRIQISRSTYERVYDLGFDFEERNVEVKGKGITQCYLLHPSHHADPLAPIKPQVFVELGSDHLDNLPVATMNNASTMAPLITTSLEQN